MAREKVLSPRLQALADWVPQGARVADVGCDHGYLPVYLLRQGRCEHVIAADIGEGPLDSARETAGRYGLTHQMRFLLCDGLLAIEKEAVDTIVIAGMGGETIQAILKNAPWTNAKGYRLLLQPMSRGEVLRTFLYENGYEIKEEALIQEGKFLYQALLVIGGGIGRRPAPWERHVSEALAKQNHPLFSQYLERTLRWLSGMAAGLERSGDGEDRRRLGFIKEEIEGLETLRKERLDDKPF